MFSYHHKHPYILQAQYLSVSMCVLVFSLGAVIRKKRCAMSFSEIPEFHADHPFLYNIRHNSTGDKTTAISLFLGTVSSLDAVIASKNHDEL